MSWCMYMTYVGFGEGGREGGKEGCGRVGGWEEEGEAS